MTPAPLSKVIKLVAGLKARQLPRDRQEVVDLINGVLELLYRTPSLMNLYFQENGCSIAQRFTEPCRNNCATSTDFMGVVMPAMVRNIREIRGDFFAYELTAEKVYPMCASPVYGPGGFANIPKAEQLPLRLLERDIPRCHDGRRVTFQSSDPEDCGEAVGVAYLDFNGREQREDLVLSPTSPVVTSYSVAEFLEIVFPDRRGWMSVSTEDGTPLGRYHPSVMVPQHEWFRLESACCGMKLQWRGLREPTPLVFDTDRAPFSDTPLWRLALKAYEFMDVMELTAAQSQGLQRIYIQLAAVSDADINAAKLNFTRVIEPSNTRAALGTGRAFSGQSRYSRSPMPWTRRW